MNIPQVDRINCRLIGGPTVLQNALVFMEEYHPKIDMGDELAKFHTYLDSGIVNNKGEHLFLHQSEPDEKNS